MAVISSTRQSDRGVCNILAPDISTKEAGATVSEPQQLMGPQRVRESLFDTWLWL